MAIRILNEGINLTKDDYEELEEYGISKENVQAAYKEASRILDKFFYIKVKQLGNYGFGNDRIPYDTLLKIYNSIDWDEDSTEEDEDTGKLLIYCNKDFPEAGDFGTITIGDGIFAVTYNEL